MRKDFWLLEKIGRIRLSHNFYMRQFLYSEIAATHGMANVPDDVELAVEVGEHLCSNILEPIAKEFGSIVIRSGFRSAVVNDYGAKNRLKCSSNADNYAFHIWDHLDENEFKGACACIVIPSLIDMNDQPAAINRIVDFAKAELNFHHMTFFANDMAFNIGWHEKPMAKIDLGKYRKLL